MCAAISRWNFFVLLSFFLRHSHLPNMREEEEKKTRKNDEHEILLSAIKKLFFLF